MYAIVEIAGKQFKVRENEKVYVPRMAGEDVDASVTLDRVLLVSGDDGISVGTPTVDGATVSAKVVAHVKGDKVLVFKKKRRKRYKVTRGHRQPYTQLLIEGIALNGKSKKSKSKKKAKAETEAPAEAEAEA